MAAQPRPSRVVRLLIQEQTSTNRRLSVIYNQLNAPFVLLDNYYSQIDDLKGKIYSEKDPRKKSILLNELKSVELKKDQLKSSITDEKIKERDKAYDNLQFGLKDLEALNKELVSSLEYEAKVALRKQQTIVLTTDLSQILSTRITTQLLPGQVLETLIIKKSNDLNHVVEHIEDNIEAHVPATGDVAYVDTTQSSIGNVFYKISKLDKSLTSGEITNVDYDKILINNGEETLETVYIKQTISTNMTIALSTNGFVLNDNEQNRGDNTVWLSPISDN